MLLISTVRYFGAPNASLKLLLSFFSTVRISVCVHRFCFVNGMCKLNCGFAFFASGQVELENLPLKKSALKSLDLPIEVKSGGFSFWD